MTPLLLIWPAIGLAAGLEVGVASGEIVFGLITGLAGGAIIGSLLTHGISWVHWRCNSRSED